MPQQLATQMEGDFGHGGALCEQTGTKLLREMISKGTILEEDLTTSNTGALYVTILRDLVRLAPGPPSFIRNMFQLNTDMKGASGSGAIKLPKTKLARGVLQGEGAKVEYETDGYESITVTPQMYAIASQLTRTILQWAGPSLISNEATRMNRGIELAVEYYGIAAIDAACDDDNANSHDNEVNTGAGGTDMDWADICEACERIETYHGVPTDIIFHPADFNALMQDTDFKDAIKYALVGKERGEILSPFGKVRGCEVWTSAYETDGTAHVIDRNNLGTFVEASDLEVADIPVGDSFNRAVGAYQFFGFGIENSDMIAEIIKAA